LPGDRTSLYGNLFILWRIFSSTGVANHECN
jgi:hypothetical protein